MVTAVNAPGGTGTITIVEQNGTSAGWDSIKVSGGTLTYGSPGSYYYYNSFQWTLQATSANGYDVAFQANTGNLWTTSTAGTTNWNLGMAAGTSPSIAQLSTGGYEIAFQANTGDLWVAGPSGEKDTGLGMMAGTSPSITG